MVDCDRELDDRRRPDILIRNPRGFDRQATLDVAVTGISSQSRTGDNDPETP